jgi:carboxyl-terminal processing protease
MLSIKKTLFVGILFSVHINVNLAFAADAGATNAARCLRQHHQNVEQQRRTSTVFDILPSGVWTSRGYGYVFKVADDGTVTALEETAISCVPNAFLLQLIKDIQITDDGNTANITAYRFVPHFVFDRTDSFQAGCANGLTPVVGDADYLRNALFEFSILERTFTERYPFFELRGIAWNESCAEARESLTPFSTDDELLKAFQSVLGPTDDYHVKVETGSTHSSYFPHKIEEHFREEFEQQQHAIVGGDLETYVEVQLQSWRQIVGGYMDGALKTEADGSGVFWWGRFKGTNVGYMQLRSVPEDMNPFVTEVDAAFLALRRSDAIVLDMRYNNGGSVRGALFVASHFTRGRFLAFRKQAIDGDTVEVYVEPGDPSYRHEGEVIVIVSGSTYSAAETITLALAQLPQTTILGRNTGGAFSELPRTLPMGWGLGLSSEIWTSPDGTNYEMVGIPPDVSPEADLLPLSERQTEIDSWLTRALETADAEGDAATRSTALMSDWTFLLPVVLCVWVF